VASLVELVPNIDCGSFFIEFYDDSVDVSSQTLLSTAYGVTQQDDIGQFLIKQQSDSDTLGDYKIFYKISLAS